MGNNNNNDDPTASRIPIEIVSEDEMALIEAALAYASRSSLSFAPSTSSSSCSAASSLLSSSQLLHNGRCIGSISVLAKRRLSRRTDSPGSIGDIEDAAGGLSSGSRMTNSVSESLIDRFRRSRCLYVTDITATEWCEKQMEFSLVLGRKAISKAMKKGSARHAVLEGEVMKKVKVSVGTTEDIWAIKFMNFIIGTNQLLLDGLTRELPIFGFVEGVWIVGSIDEIRMPGMDEMNPILVDTKTRMQPKLPTGPQQRNGRLQLMCYKYLWDSLVTDTFPSSQFFEFFSLNRNYILSEEARELTIQTGFPAQTLDELVRYFTHASSVLRPAHDQLLLRYELQEDSSLLGEGRFPYDVDWVTSQIRCCLQFWLEEREPSYTPEEERWKCRLCQYASVCSASSGNPGDQPK